LIDEKEYQGGDVFKMLDFDFMPIGTELVCEKIRDTPKNQPSHEDWSQFFPQPQGPLSSPPSPSQDLSYLDKGLVTPLHLGNEEGTR
jgi:hypothetical protein